MPLIQPASVLLSDQAGISVGMSAATPNAPICAQAWAAHITTTARFKRKTAGIWTSAQPCDQSRVVRLTNPISDHPVCVQPAKRGMPLGDHAPVWPARGTCVPSDDLVGLEPLEVRGAERQPLLVD